MYTNYKINWLNIIFISEFQSYLNTGTIKEISLLSKVAREKLKHLVFIKLKVSKSNLDYSKNNIIIESYKPPELKNYDSSVFEDSKYHGIDSVLNDFAIAVRDIKKFSKSLQFCSFGRPGIYLFPFISIFDNLTDLQLSRDVMIPHSGFVKLGESLINLTHIKLSACLYKLPTENFSPKDYIFPPNLKYLEIFDNRFFTISTISNHKFIIQRDYADYLVDYFKLPKISIPSLRDLVFHFFIGIDLGLKDFLEVNPNLKSLSIRSYNLNFVEELNNSDQISILKYIEFFHIVVNMSENFEKIKKLCLVYTNLEGIHIEADCIAYNSEELMDSKLMPIISNLNHLKTLKLDITLKDKYLNLTKLSNIEKLVLKTQDIVILNLDFINCKKLKKVVFNSNNFAVNTKEYRDKFNGYKNWIFKFSQFSIKGFKLNQ
ncbi:hypothetical protein CONCODRAFT_73695 [Conidiobolus coronatus NRRL 28638]|uniref:F-box domain-containing protein n=1 Tax=Conidiobolus coronatus (strain ATCC 28846 / CBS 209.66 / NRRL 28638) TaxID=796925 RepID=A0A137NUL0_CONC2|nr:hypothetical protein CONCODRAFT_73695 [Conidiobolus coronatus NRRL 28638]|eukprot:KXN66412.1 hypothetical protein CONCODRAFT_73695 [Conidiobolus coronatus NRRL 28638]